MPRKSRSSLRAHTTVSASYHMLAVQKHCKTSSRRHFVARLPAQSAPHWWQERPSTRHAIRTDMLTRHEKRETKWRVVAGGGLEPPDLQGMNLASYQLLHPANKKYSTMWTKKRGASRRLHKADTNAPDGENSIRQLMWAFAECSKQVPANLLL